MMSQTNIVLHKTVNFESDKILNYRKTNREIFLENEE